MTAPTDSQIGSQIARSTPHSRTAQDPTSAPPAPPHPDGRRSFLPSASGIAILVLALAVRIADLGGPSLWFDELLEYERATGTWRELLVGRGIDQDPPLFALFSRLWFAIIPVHSEALLRLPSALAGTAATGLVGSWATRRFGRQIGVLAGLFMAVAPVQVHYARELNQYVWMTLLALIAILTWERVRETWAGRDWLVHGIVTIASLLLHYGLAFPLAVVGIDLALSARRRSRPGADRLSPHTSPPPSPQRPSPPPPAPWRPLIAYALAVGAVVGILLALGLADRLDTGHVQKRWGGTHLEKEIDYILDTGWREVLVFFFLPFAGGTAIPIVRALSLLSLAGLVDLWRNTPSGRRIFGGLLLGTLTMTYVASVFGLYPLGFRHGLFNAPLLLVALAAGVAWVGRVLGAIADRIADRTAEPIADSNAHPPVARTVDPTTALPFPRRHIELAIIAGLAGAICAVFLAFSPLEWWPNPHLSVPREHGREAATSIVSLAAPGEAIYVYHAAAPAFRFYALGAGSAEERGEGGAEGRADIDSIVWGRPFDSRDAQAVALEAGRIAAAAHAGPSGQVLLYFVHVNAAERAALHVALEDLALSPSRGPLTWGGNAVVESWSIIGSNEADRRRINARPRSCPTSSSRGTSCRAARSIRGRIARL